MEHTEYKFTAPDFTISQKVDLILDHLGLEIAPEESKTVKAYLRKKSIKKEKE